MCDSKPESVGGGMIGQSATPVTDAYHRNQDRLKEIHNSTYGNIGNARQRPTEGDITRRMDVAQTEYQKLSQLHQLLDAATLTGRETLLMLELCRELGYRI